MHFIDSHCHIDFEQFDTDRDSILNHCRQLGIDQIIVPAVSRSRWSKQLKLCEQHTMLFATLGLHPMFMNEHQSSDIAELDKQIVTTKPVAIGEIGLDFYLADHDKTSQIALFEQQLELAKHHDLPVVLHVRKAHDQVLALLKKYAVHHGIVHAFSGSLQQADNYINQGLLLGAGGTLSYQNAKRIKSVFSQIPLQNIALETDAPDMPLQSHRGQRNSPEFIAEIARLLAEMRQSSVDIIAKQTSLNVQNLFSLPSS